MCEDQRSLNTTIIMLWGKLKVVFWRLILFEMLENLLNSNTLRYPVKCGSSKSNP